MIIDNNEKFTAETAKSAALTTRIAFEAWQMERMREVLDYTARNSAFYSERLVIVKPENVICPSDLERVPFTVANDVCKSPRGFLCVSHKEVARIASLRTSGTTAAAKRIFFTEDDLARTVRFFSRGMLPIVGTGNGVLIMMSNSTPDSIASLLHRGLAANKITSKIHGYVADAEYTASEAAKFDCLVGLPAEMLYLCKSSPYLRPKSVLLSADYASESLIATIRETWQCKVFTHYGMTETCYGCAVQQEENSTHHIRNKEMFIEIIDPHTGAKLPDGKSGEIVITTFASRAMPLIRYRTGDISSLVTDAKSLESMPGLSRILGRIQNQLCLGEGQSVSVEQLDDVLYAMNDVKAYRAIKKTDGSLLLEVDCTLETTLRAIREELSQKYNGVCVEADLVRLQPSTGTRKRKIIVEGEYTCSATSAKKR